MDVGKIREFNRYYARILGIFDKRFLGMDFSVTEVRIIGEIGRNSGMTAQELGVYLSVDKGYLSRMLQALEKKGILLREKSEKDAREKILKLTDFGAVLNRELEEKADRRILEQIKEIGGEKQQALLNAMETIREILGEPTEKEEGGKKKCID